MKMERERRVYFKRLAQYLNYIQRVTYEVIKRERPLVIKTKEKLEGKE